jgi:hypothetical protein
MDPGRFNNARKNISLKSIFSANFRSCSIKSIRKINIIKILKVTEKFLINLPAKYM